MKQSKRIALRNLREYKCHRCFLSKHANTICIMGTGSLKKPIMLVGEAPGETEDEKGLPFVGKCGKWLRELLREVGIYDRCYLTNSAKCRPAGNSAPRACHADRCAKFFLSKEFEILDPAVVILLGKTASGTVMGKYWWKDGFGKHTYINHRWFDAYVATTWHPAYCLRKGKPKTDHLLRELQWAKQYA